MRNPNVNTTIEGYYDRILESLHLYFKSTNISYLEDVACGNFSQDHGWASDSGHEEDISVHLLGSALPQTSQEAGVYCHSIGVLVAHPQCFPMFQK